MGDTPPTIYNILKKQKTNNFENTQCNIPILKISTHTHTKQKHIHTHTQKKQHKLSVIPKEGALIGEPVGAFHTHTQTHMHK